MNLLPPSVTGFLAACVLILLQAVAGAESADDLVVRGNTAYNEGKFDEALSLYDEASVTAPEAAGIHYNRGTVHYRMEDYAAATDAFREAAVRAKQPALASRAKYNLGNCAFRGAQRQRDSDLKKAIEHCQESIAYYQEARDLDPDYRDAAENIEIVRLYVKVLLDEQKKKQEQQEQQQEQQENLVEKLKKLIARQNELIGQNEGLRAARPGATDPPALQSWKDALQGLSGEQATLRTDTGGVLVEMRQTIEQIRQQAASGGAPGGTPGAPPQAAAPDATAFAEKIEVASGHVGNAMADEQLAETALASDQQDPALVHQSNAVQDLEEAVKALADDQQQQQQQPGDQDQEQQDQEQDQEQQDQEQEQQGDEEQNQDQEQEQDQEQQQDSQDENREQEQQQQEAQARAEQAEDILDEEKENQKQRQPVRPARTRPVDKDW